MKEIILDCSEITEEAQLHQALFRVLDLPEWYGHNLDALFDCLTELETQTHLTFLNWDMHASYSDKFLSVFSDAVESGSFCYTLADFSEN